MSFFNELSALTKAGPAAAEPAPVEAPAPALAPAPESTAAAPVAPVATQEPSAVPSLPAVPAGAEPLYTAAGAFRGILKADGSFVVRTSEQPTDVLANLSAEDRRPIDWEEESRVEGMAQRTPGRIQFLLLHETEAQRNARIANDLARGYKAASPRDPEKTRAAEFLKLWRN